MLETCERVLIGDGYVTGHRPVCESIGSSAFSSPVFVSLKE